MSNPPRRDRPGIGRRMTQGLARGAQVWRRLLTRDRGGDAVQFPYRGQIATGHVPLLALLAFPIEILLIVRLAPWGWLMWVLILVSALAFIWLVTLYAAFLMLPHRLGPTDLDLHYGLIDAITIPIAAIEKVAVDVWDAPTDRDGLHLSDDHFVASLPIAHQTQVALLLHLSLEATSGLPDGVRVIRCAADDPEAMVRAITNRIARHRA